MHQYLFFIGDFPIRAYGLVLSLSIILATGVGYFLAKVDGQGAEKHVVDLGIYCGVAGLIGARLWDVFFFDWGYYHNHLTEIMNVWQGGMAIQGGVVLGVLTGVWYCRRHHLDVVHLMDVFAPAIILGQALGRCANLLNGDAFGAPTGSRTTNHAKGQCFALYVMLYSLARFFLEYLRGDYTAPVLGLFHSAQMTSVVGFVIAAAFFIGLAVKQHLRK